MSNYPPGYNGIDGTATQYYRCTGTIGPEPHADEDIELCTCQWDADGIIELGVFVPEFEELLNCPECGAEGEQV